MTRASWTGRTSAACPPRTFEEEESRGLILAPNHTLIQAPLQTLLLWNLEIQRERVKNRSISTGHCEDQKNKALDQEKVQKQEIFMNDFNVIPLTSLI